MNAYPFDLLTVHGERAGDERQKQNDEPHHFIT